MSLPTGVIRLELEADSVVANGKSVENTLNRIETKSESVGKKTEFSTKLMATSLLGLGTSAFSAYQGFDQLEKVQLRAEKSALAVTRAQKQVNDLEREGKTNTEEYTIATERLRLAQEQASQAAGDVKQQIIQLGLSLATTGLTMGNAVIALRGMTLAHGAAATAATAQAAANTGLTFSFRGLTAAMMSNPLGIALVAGSIGALAVYQTNLLGVRDKVDGLISSFTLGKQPVSDLHSEFDHGIDTTQRYTNSVRDLGKEYENTLSILKKNEIEVAGTVAQDILLIGSLKSIANDLIESDAIDLMDLVQKDARLPEKLKQIKSVVESTRGNFFIVTNRDGTIRAVRFDAIGPNITTATPGKYSFKFQNAPLGGQVGGILSSFAAHGGVNITGEDALKISSGLIGPAALRNALNKSSENAGFGGYRGTSGSNKARRGGHGGNKPGWGVAAVEQPFLQSIQGLMSTIDELALFGFNIQAPSFNLSTLVRGYKSPSNEFLQQSIRQAEAGYNSQLAEYNRQVAAARAKIAQDAGFIGLDSGTYVSLYRTDQGRSDIAGMTLYKQLAALA